MHSPRWDQKIYPPLKIAAVVDALAAEGVPLRDALQRTQISEAQLRSPYTLVSVNQVIEAYRNALRLTKTPDFAYQTGLKTHVAAYGMYGFAILSSKNFRETMQFVVKYHHLATPLVRIRFEESAKCAAWCIDPIPHPAIDRCLYRFIIEMQLGVHISLHRDVMGPTFGPSELRMTYGAFEDNESLAIVRGCPCLFDQLENRLLFDSSWLNGVPACGNDITFACILRVCEELKNEMAQRVGVAGQVHQSLIETIGRDADINEIANQLGMSARTLRRKLQEQGTSFYELLSELKSHVAIKYLRDTQMTVEDIANALKFSDSANFRRAFRRWTRTSPQAFRRMIGC
jgi:AraC-like DNA-binding protein